MMEKNYLRLNAFFSIGSQALKMVLTFLIRKVLIETLGVEYVGYNSVFNNILQMLNLADLGIGIAITTFLYKPVATKKVDEICDLMCVYRRIYSYIGLVVLSLGFVVSVFLQYIIPDAKCNTTILRGYFLLYLISVVSTYYLAQKRTLIVASQRGYIASCVDSIALIVTTSVEIFLLLKYRSFFWYLIMEIAKVVGANLIISHECDKLYPDICNLRIEDANKERNKTIYFEIIKFIKDIFVSRIGAYIYYSTDNLILSVFRGASTVGYFSNYTVLTSGINSVVTYLFATIQSTYGNYIATHKEMSDQRIITEHYLCAFYFIGNFCFICIIFLIQPFVTLIFGHNYVLGNDIVILLALNLLMSTMIQHPSHVFTVYKLYKYDKPIIVLSAFLNIVISIMLVINHDISGVLIGTFVTSLVYLFSRFFIISKYVFEIRYTHYILILLRYAILSFISFVIVYCVTYNLTDGTWISFIQRVFIVVMSCVLTESFLLAPSKSFRFIIKQML